MGPSEDVQYREEQAVEAREEVALFRIKYKNFSEGRPHSLVCSEF